MRGDGIRLKPGRRTYTLQVATPVDLVRAGLVKVKVVERPLGTANRSEAKVKAAAIRAEILAEFDQIRKGLPISDEAIKRIAEEETRRGYDLLATDFLAHHPNLEKYAADIAESAKHPLDAAIDPNPMLGNRPTYTYAEAKLRQLGREPTGDAVMALSVAILKAHAAAVAAVQRGHRPPELPYYAPPAMAGTSKRVSDIIGSYIASRTKAKPKTRREAETILHAFSSFAGDPRVDAIDRAMVTAWSDKLRSEGSAAATIKKYLFTVRKFWLLWVHDKNLVKAGAPNPFDRQAPETDPDAGWKPFTLAELQKLLEPSNVRWYVITAIFSGLRLGEIVGGHIRRHGRQHYFEVTAGKTKAARRSVPVHPTLIRMGIVAAWPKFNVLTDNVASRRFGRWRELCGIDDDRKVFHSLRKNFTKALEHAHVSTNVVAALLGHSRGFSFDVYNPDGPEFKMLAAAVAKVSYRGLRIGV